jgi:hypothetical protein
VVGLALVAAAVAGVGPPALAAALGVLGVGLMAAYGYRLVRSGYLRGGLPDGSGGEGEAGDVGGGGGGDGGSG